MLKSLNKGKSVFEIEHQHPGEGNGVRKNRRVEQNAHADRLGRESLGPGRLGELSDGWADVRSNGFVINRRRRETYVAGCAASNPDRGGARNGWSVFHCPRPATGPPARAFSPPSASVRLSLPTKCRIASPRRRCHHRTTVPQSGLESGHSPIRRTISYSERRATTSPTRSRLSGLTKKLDLPFVPHGLRSSFRDWAGERDDINQDAAEAALAHAIGDQTKRAYLRTNFFTQRRELMQEWADYVTRTMGPVISEMDTGSTDPNGRTGAVRQLSFDEHLSVDKTA